MRRVHVIVSGRVQGIGYRAWTQKQASALELTGWVRNNADGTVEIVAEGDQLALDDFILMLHRGPRLSVIRTVNKSWEQALGDLPDFRVLY